MIDQQLKQYNINLTDNQKKILLNYLNELKVLFQKENIDLDAFYDIENSIIEQLIENKNNITDKHIDNILKDLWTPEEIIEPFKKERLSVLDELKQIFPLSWDKKELFKHYWILLLKIIWWILIGLWILGIIWFILLFVNISVFNIDITASIPLFLKILTFLISILVVFLWSYLINFKKSRLRNYTTWLLIILIIFISIFWWYNLISKYSNLNKYSNVIENKLATWTNYEIWDINLFGPLTWNIIYTTLTKELTREYIDENKDFITFVSWDKLKINITRNILWNKYDAKMFNKNISNLKINIINNKIYIFRSWYYFKHNNKLMPFYPRIKIQLPNNVNVKNKHKEHKEF